MCSFRTKQFPRLCGRFERTKRKDIKSEIIEIEGPVEVPWLENNLVGLFMSKSLFLGTCVAEDKRPGTITTCKLQHNILKQTQSQ